MALRLRHFATALQRPSASPISSSTVARTSTYFRRTMASSNVPTPAPGKFEWLVVVPDKPGMKAKRLEVRPQHFAGLAKHLEAGAMKTGGAYFHTKPDNDDPTTWDFAGSTIVIEAASKEEIVEMLNADIYASSGVWDVENAQILPAKFAFRKL
ncbi:hypothetical protein Micbo1qcDRAFT_67229 [Microdochium bolleyi]|uniref:YCII-related domain-containing protein n=1 Tax=Microdochium bolleyi TaxID=196109 RepID=A0A136J0R4_9PEZI|nr:hypothetical protein Micbo1qcDRAFT_67229 [Microdochium bolleyi]